MCGKTHTDSLTWSLVVESITTASGERLGGGTGGWRQYKTNTWHVITFLFIYLFYIFLYCPFSKTACIQKTYFCFLRASLSSEASSTDNKHRKLVVAHQLVATVGIHCRKHNFLRLMTNIRARESIHVLLLKEKQIHNDLLLLHFMLKQNFTSAMNCTQKIKYNLLLFYNSVVSVFSSAYKQTHTLRFSKSINYIAYRRYLTIRNIVLLNYFRSLSQQRTTPSPYCKTLWCSFVTNHVNNWGI